MTLIERLIYRTRHTGCAIVTLGELLELKAEISNDGTRNHPVGADAAIRPLAGREPEPGESPGGNQRPTRGD